MKKRALISALALLAALTAVLLGVPGLDRDRRIYVSTDLESDQELARVEGVARTASEHGINGMLLSAGFDSLDLKSAASPRAPRTLETDLRPRGSGDHSRGF